LIFINLGAGVIGDIATPSERGSYFGFFSIGQNLGPVLGPVLGGIISEALSWRWIFWILLMIGGAFFIAIFFFLPETLRSLVGNGSGHANPTPSQWWERRQQAKKHQSRDIEAPVTSDTASETSTIANAEDKRTTTKSRFLQVPDVTQPFTYLLQKDVIIALVYNAIHYATYYCYMTSTPTQFELIYGMSEIQVGLCFLPSGIGCIIGSFIGGRLLDHDFKKVGKQANFENVKRSQLSKDFPIFKARLRSVYIAGGLLQVITLFYGWMLYIQVHLAVVLVLQFIG
jgi:MFS family permease